jgi:hypothetical protein
LHKSLLVGVVHVAGALRGISRREKERCCEALVNINPKVNKVRKNQPKQIKTKQKGRRKKER